MEQERSVDKLARMIILGGTLAIAGLICWYFRSVLAYIIGAFVVSLIGQPVFRLLRKVRVKGKSAPDSLLAVLTLVLMALGVSFVVTQIIPVVGGIVSDASLLSSYDSVANQSFFEKVNAWLLGVLPWLGEDFDLLKLAVDELSNISDFSAVPGFIGSVASVMASAVIGIFSVVFISFFFIKDESLFGRIVGAMVPDSMESKVGKTIQEITRLLSRYFVGMIVEIFGVMILDLLGLWLIARVGFSYAIGIAFIAGLLNVIPYVGPLIGEVLGVVLCVVLKLGTGAGLDVNIWIFALIVLGIMLAVQLVDNFVYQPVIYSASIKASPLEIFIVLLMAGHIGGTFGMLIAIPSYTVIRVIASRFFSHTKVVQRLIPGLEHEKID